jgi:type III secretion system chaperone SycN
VAYTHIINEFVRRLGVDPGALAPGGPVQLHIQGMGTLFIEERGEDALLYLARVFPEYDSEVPLRALALCHYAHKRAFTVQAGLYKDNALFFLVAVPVRDFSIQKLEQIIPELSRLLDKALSVT